MGEFLSSFSKEKSLCTFTCSFIFLRICHTVFPRKIYVVSFPKLGYLLFQVDVKWEVLYHLPSLKMVNIVRVHSLESKVEPVCNKTLHVLSHKLSNFNEL